MDRYLRQDLKNRLADSVYGSANSTLAERITLLHGLIQTSLGSSTLTKLLRLTTVSIISIVFIYSIQFHANRQSFDSIFANIVTNLRENPTFILLTATSFVIIDLISFFQTLTFMRLTGNCKNIFEIAFLAIADITLSLFIVIAVLPVLIFVVHKTTTFPQERTVHLAISGGLQRQDLSIYEVLRMAVPTIRPSSPEEESAFKGDLANFNASGWYYNMPNLSATDKGAPELDQAVAGLEFRYGQSLYFTKGDMTIEEEGLMLAEALTMHSNIVKAVFKDGYSDTFGNYVVILEIVGTGDYSRLSLLANYPSLMSDVNFFGQDFGKVFNFAEKGYTENQLAWESIFNTFVKDMGETIVLKCENEKPVDLARKSFANEGRECSRGVAITKLNVEAISALTSYKMSNPGSIPVLPTSLSSIFLTAVIYIMTLGWIILPHVRRMIAKYTEDGDRIFTENVFMISLFVVFFACLPVWLVLG